MLAISFIIVCSPFASALDESEKENNFLYELYSEYGVSPGTLKDTIGETIIDNITGMFSFEGEEITFGLPNYNKSKYEDYIVEIKKQIIKLQQDILQNKGESEKEQRKKHRI